jgi:hypothetical protein
VGALAAPFPTTRVEVKDLPGLHASRGVVVGEVAPCEDATLLARTLVGARDLVLRDAKELLTHADLDPTASPAERQGERERKLRALGLGRLNRYVLALETTAGPRIVKIAEVTSAGNALLGVLGSSVPRCEHALHLRTQALGLAASETRGYLEWRRGLRLLRACQVQTPMAPDAVTLGTFLVAELRRFGEAALDRFGQALARVHARRFFHADLKGFHAIVTQITRCDPEPATYELQWIDLARVSFYLTPRKRIINLYQALRFVVPRRPEAEERFVRAYCAASGWHAATPELALARVRRFLAYKYRTYPLP